MGCERFRGRLVVATLAIAAGGPPVALAQVYKCVDGGGRVTYQQEPCPGQQRGGRIEIQDPLVTRETPEREAQWEAAAKEGNLLAGMPKAWVRKSLGDPSESRPGRPGDRAVEVWGFPAHDGRVLRVGFVAGNVVWFRHEAAAAGGGAVPAGVEAPADSQPAAPKPVNPREQIPAGMACSDVIAKLGMPDRREIRENAAAKGAGVETRHIYEPGPADPSARTTIVCVAGKVVTVERGGS